MALSGQLLPKVSKGVPSEMACLSVRQVLRISTEVPSVSDQVQQLLPEVHGSGGVYPLPSLR